VQTTAAINPLAFSMFHWTDIVSGLKKHFLGFNPKKPNLGF